MIRKAIKIIENFKGIRKNCRTYFTGYRMEILLQSIVGVEMEYSSSVVWIEAITIGHILFDFLLLPKMAIIRKSCLSMGDT